MRQQKRSRRDVHPCDNHKAAGGPFSPATTAKQQAGNSTLRRRKIESDAASLRLRPRQAELQYFATKKIGIGHGIVAATTAAGGTAILCDEENLNRTRHRCGNACAGELFYLPARWHCIDSRFQAQTCESMQPKGQNKGDLCIDS